MKYLSKVSSGEQYFSNDIKNYVKNGYLKSQNLSEEKKNPHRVQIFRYFRIESRNNNTTVKHLQFFLPSNNFFAKGAGES